MARPPFEMIDAARSTAGFGATAGRRPVDRPLGRRGADILARVPLFAGLPRRHIRNIAGRSDLVSFRQGSPVVVAGMPGGSMFVILEGAPAVGVKVLQALARRLREMERPLNG